MDYNPQVNSFALVYLTAFGIESSTQYGLLENNGKSLKKKTTTKKRTEKTL